MSGASLSRELRGGEGAFLRQRRQTVGLSLIASAAMGVITLYQMGLISHLPEPPLPYLDADKVDAAPEAYNRAGTATPDAALGLVNYAATVVLASMAGPGRARALPWLPLVLAAKVGVDAINAGYLTYEQIAKHKALCSYCLLASAATFATIPLVLPEARAAWQHLRRNT